MNRLTLEPGPSQAASTRPETNAMKFILTNLLEIAGLVILGTLCFQWIQIGMDMPLPR